MKKYITISLFLLLCSFSVSVKNALALTSQEKINQQINIANGQMSASSDGLKLVKFDSSIYGYIYTSSDGGANWTKRFGGDTYRFTQIISSQDGKKVFVVGGTWKSQSDTSSYKAALFVSNDSGVTWTQNSNVGFSNIAASSDFTKLVGTDSREIWTSNDGGVTWIKRVSVAKITTNYDQSNQVFITTPSVGLVPTDDLPQYLKNQNENNKQAAIKESKAKETLLSQGVGIPSASSKFLPVINPLNSHSWSSVTISADGIHLAAADSWDISFDDVLNGKGQGIVGGYIYTSDDSGITWKQQKSSGTGQWSAVVYSPDGSNLIAVQNGGYSHHGSVIISKDKGLTWEKQTVLGLHSWTGAAISNDGTKISVSDSHSYDPNNLYKIDIYTSIDNGVNWNEETYDSNASIAPDLNTPTSINTNSLGLLNISKNLKFGQNDEEVKKLQQYLINHNYLSGVATGYYGGKTKIAVQKLQVDLGIQADGSSVGPKTRTALSVLK